VFILHSFYYSIFVALRMIPILLATGFTLFLVVRFLQTEPLALVIVIGAIYIPLLLFLYLNSLRAALVAMRQTGPPVVAKLWMGTVRLMRFSFLLNNLILGLVGMGGTVALLLWKRPDLWQFIFREIERDDVFTLETWTFLAAEVPVAVLPIWAFATSISIGIIGTSAAATAAWVAERGPNHDALWGLLEDFPRLFILALLVVFLPTVAIMYLVGGPMVGLDTIMSLPWPILIAAPVYIAWIICVIAAGKALAYARTAIAIEERFNAEQDAMVGDAISQEDLRAMRQERMERGRLDPFEAAGMTQDEVNAASDLNASGELQQKPTE